MKLRLAKKVSRWCDPSLGDIDGIGDVDLQWLWDRRQRYRRGTRATAAKAMAKHRRRRASWFRGPLANAFRDIAYASMVPGAPMLGYIIRRTLLTTPPRRYAPIDNI